MVCVLDQLLETAAHRRETQLATHGKAAVHRLLDWTAALPAMGASRGSSAGQLRGECGTSSDRVRRKWVEPRLAALVGPAYIRDRSFKCRIAIRKGVTLLTSREWALHPVPYGTRTSTAESRTCFLYVYTDGLSLLVTRQSAVTQAWLTMWNNTVCDDGLAPIGARTSRVTLIISSFR